MVEKKKYEYVGKGKENGNYGMINFWIDTKKLKPNENGFVNLTMGTMRNTDDKGNTHTVWINDFKPVKREPEKKSFDNRVNEKELPLPPPIVDEDLPF